jgi:hypothetical protein
MLSATHSHNLSVVMARPTLRYGFSIVGAAPNARAKVTPPTTSLNVEGLRYPSERHETA